MNDHKPTDRAQKKPKNLKGFFQNVTPSVEKNPFSFRGGLRETSI